MEHSAPTLLMVEDDPEISRLAAAFLRREGFATELAESGAAMDAALTRIRPDLIILDLMLPGEDGLSICRRLRQSHDVPILILSAKSEEVDRVIGLELGADDYLTKPFGPRELLARIRALLRRAQGRVTQGRVTEGGTSPARRYGFDRFVIDLDARAFETEAGEAVALTTAEFDLLACLARHPRRVLTRDQILDFTHGRAAGPFDRTVDMLISRLRRKLEGASPGSGLITTVRNGGYLFTAHVRRLGA
ncbi:response regulator transcription factor [Rhodovarius crocodyli]|uniref:Regulatory protein VirG n=1 Tax=Rhodovarius crocodyli TaxID=1979269 RepID=A0A437LXA0_9PROT|nr:response regulator transcription factor [Rhodovarius crocodyli]RVT90021.1 response regulator transcription factor [Rhodovarius crocodyli]